MSRPVPNPGILDIAPYTPGKSPVPEGGRKLFKLSGNETTFGPSPKAMDAYRRACRRYISPSSASKKLSRPGKISPRWCSFYRAVGRVSA